MNSDRFDEDPIQGSEGALLEYRNATFGYSDTSHSFTFRDYVNGEINSTRLYQDMFPNEITEIYNLDNYKQIITNDNGDDDPTNDVIIEAPQLQSLISLKHTTDDVPAIFDSRMTIESSGITTQNILASTKTVSISDTKTDLNKVVSSLDVIQVIPEEGVIYNSNPRYNPENIQGEYWYYDSSQNGVMDTIFVVNEDHEVIAVGFDYDYNKYLQPNKQLFVEKHIIRESTLGFEGLDQMTVDQLTSDDLIYLRDYESYDGYTLDPTFSDSLYDLWKIQYTLSSSKLIDEVKSITSRQFIESIRSRIVDDIIWQVEAQLIGVAVGVIFSAIASPLGPLGYLLGYGIANAIKAYKEKKENARIMASQTFHNEDYEGEVTLSSMKAHDKLWGGTLPDIIGWSTSGTYTEVQVETNKHLFKGELILAPKGVKKTKDFGLTNVPISLDYALQTRSYLMYSDFDDEHVSIYTLINPDLKYMANSLMYLENAISQETNDEYNIIYPYMIYGQGTFVPTFQFAGLDTKHPVPEFYHEYPIYVDEEYYLALEEEYHIIYKVFDSESLQALELLPEDATHQIFGKINNIDVHFFDSKGLSYELGPYFLDEGDYVYDNATGILTLSDSLYTKLRSTLSTLENVYSEIQDYTAYYIFEVKIEKYRSIDPKNAIDTHIATMQAIEQSILEYTYQFRHAQKTQQGLSEMFYTFFVTSISTIITTAITLGIGAIANSLSSESVKVAASGQLTKEFGKAYTKQVLNTASKRIAAYFVKFGSIRSWQCLSIILSPIKETLQEIFVDPYLDIIVSDLVVRLGLDVFWQVLASSLVEGGRETATGPLSQFLFCQTQTNPSTQVDNQHITNEMHSTDQISVQDNIQEAQDRSSVKVKWSSILKTGASLVLGTALVGIGGPMFFGTSFVLGFSAIKSFSKSFEFSKKTVKDVVQQSVDEIVEADVVDAVHWAIAETMEDLIEESVDNLPEDNTPKPTQEMFDSTADIAQPIDAMDNYISFMSTALRPGSRIHLLDPPSPPEEQHVRHERREILNEIYLILESYKSSIRFIRKLKGLVPILEAANFDYGMIIRWIDSGTSISQIFRYLTDYAKKDIISKIKLKFTTRLNLNELISIKIYQDRPPSLDFIYLDSKIQKSNDPFEKLYFRVCKEIMKLYADPQSKDAPKEVTAILGEILEIEDLDRPLQITKVSKLMGMGEAYLTDLLRRSGRDLSTHPQIYFKTLAQKMQPAYVKIFGEDIAKSIVDDYLKGEGYRFQLLYSLYSILCKKTGTYYSFGDFSKIFFGNSDKASVLLRTPDPTIRDLDQMWTLEYLISKMAPITELGFEPDEFTLNEIIRESTAIVREAFRRQLRPTSLSPLTIDMLLESLHALSEVGGFYSLARLSRLIDNHHSKLYLTGKVFAAGRNPADSVVRNLLRILFTEGVSSNHKAVQYAVLFLEMRGLELIDFDFYLNKFKHLSGDRVSENSILSHEEKLMAKTIVWALSGGRSWKTGERISIDETWLHHIYHDSTGKTLYGADFESAFTAFAAVKGNKENKEVEEGDWRIWEDKFIEMWQKFKIGDFEGATEHWNEYDPQRQADFLRERRSRSYLDYWLSIINQ